MRNAATRGLLLFKSLAIISHVLWGLLRFPLGSFDLFGPLRRVCDDSNLASHLQKVVTLQFALVPMYNVPNEQWKYPQWIYFAVPHHFIWKPGIHGNPRNPGTISRVCLNSQRRLMPWSMEGPMGSSVQWVVQWYSNITIVCCMSRWYELRQHMLHHVSLQSMHWHAMHMLCT